MLRERRWLLSIVLCVTLSVTMLWTPMYAQAADNDSGQTTENTFINSDGAAAYMADGFAYRYIDEDGYFNSDGTMPDGEGISIRIIGYYGQGTKIDIPEKIDGYDVTEVRWSKNNPSGVAGEIDYDKVTEINIPSKMTSYRRLYSDAQQSFTVAEGNVDFAAKDGVLYRISRYVDEGYEYANAYLWEYPRSKNATDYTIPDKVKDASVTYVDFDDFYYSGLESIHIPAGIESINAVNSISTLKEVVVDPDNKNYRSEDGVLFDTTIDDWDEEPPTRNNFLILYPAAKAGEKYTVPDGVKEVCDYSFRNTMVKTIVFPSSVTYIDMGAFNDSSVTEMVFLSKTAPELYDRCEPFEGRSVKITYPEGASGYEKLEAMAAGRNNYWEEDWYSGDEIPLGANIAYYMRYVPYKGEVVFKYSTDEDGPFTEAAPDKEGEYYVKAVVAETESYIGLESDVQCHKFVAADGEQKENAIDVSTMYWEYDGKGHSVTAVSMYGTPVVTYTPYVWDEAEEDYVLDASKATTTPPTEAGRYLVNASVEGTDDYTSAGDTIDMEIGVASNKWLEKLSCTDVEEGTAPAPSAKAAFGEVKYLYSDTATGGFTATVPEALGDHYVKAVVDETNNFEGLESAPVQFTIKQKVVDPGQGETGGNNGQNTPGKQDEQIDGQGGKTPAPAQTVAKKANTMRVVFKNKTIKAKKLKKKAFAYKAVKVKAAKGTVVYTVKPIGKKSKKVLKFNKKTGKIKIKKKTKKGVYKMKITVKAKGNAQYNPSKKFTKTIKVKVK